MVLNMPLDYLSCLTVILKGIHRKVDICQTDYSIHSKLNNFPYSEVTHGSTAFKLTKGWQRFNKNDRLLNLMFFFFHFLRFNVPDNKCHKQKWRMLFFTRIKLVAQVLACARVIASIKSRRLSWGLFWYRFCWYRIDTCVLGCIVVLGLIFFKLCVDNFGPLIILRVSNKFISNKFGPL